MDEYDLGGITPERLANLNFEQRSIIEARIEKNKERAKLVAMIEVGNEETYEKIFNALRDMEQDNCEHNRPIWKSCIACNEIEMLLFPELYSDGLRISKD